MSLLKRVWERALDGMSLVVFMVLGVLLTVALFMLRIIPDRERAAEERSREEAQKRADDLKAKVAAAKAARDAALAAEEARIRAAADERKRESALAVANALIRRRRR